ncbi:MAG: hypothetical protein LUC50_07480 [Ruminococcus sp.]|nr:hypothetical protein [Ruminococcus sp.]
MNRSESFRSVLDTALRGRHTQENLELNGRIYQLIANAVCNPNASQEIAGVVILILDVTEREEQERYR